MRALSIATVFVAVAGYLVLWIASKGLSKAGYEDFMVYWSFFFAATGFLDGLMQETTRAVSTRRSQDATAESAAGAAGAADTVAEAAEVMGEPVLTTDAQRTSPAGMPRARPFRIAAFVALVTGVGILATGWFWVGALLNEQPVWGLMLLTVGLASYALQTTVAGLLSAAREWGTFAWLIAVDSGVRLALAAIAWAMGWQLLAYLVVTVLGAAIWSGILLLSGKARRLLHERADVPRRAFGVRVVKAMIAAGASAVLITGFTVLLRSTTAASVAPGALAATITAVTLTRAPILVPLQRFQPALIVHFTRHRTAVLKAALQPITAIIGVAVVGMVAAWLIGAPLMRIFFDADLVAVPATLGLLTLVSGATAILMVSGSAALAADRHNVYIAGWVLATLVAIGILALNFSPEMRAILALGIGPLVGAGFQLAMLSLTRKPIRMAAHDAAIDCSGRRTSGHPHETDSKHEVETDA